MDNNVYLCRIPEDNQSSKDQFDYTLICNPHQYQNEPFILIPKSMKYDDNVINRQNCGPKNNLENNNSYNTLPTLFRTGLVNDDTALTYPSLLSKCSTKGEKYIPDLSSQLYKLRIPKTTPVEMTNKLLFKTQQFCNTQVPDMAKNQTPFHNFSRYNLDPFNK